MNTIFAQLLSNEYLCNGSPPVMDEDPALGRFHLKSSHCIFSVICPQFAYFSIARIVSGDAVISVTVQRPAPISFRLNNRHLKLLNLSSLLNIFLPIMDKYFFSLKINAQNRRA